MTQGNQQMHTSTRSTVAAPRSRRGLAALVLGALLLTFVGWAPTSPQAVADTAPPDASLPATVSSDPLPTVQINGVAWSQVVIGNTVYVGGSFGTARPANAAAGTSTVNRTNLLAYDITTGDLKTSFAPNLNGQVRGVAASPDGSRLYVVGQFTTVNGITRNRIAAFDTATGNLVTSFAPSANATVYGVTVTENTVYLGGSFTLMNSSTRIGAAAVATSTGATTAFAPVAQTGSAVRQLVVSPDRTKVVLGGNFTTMNGSGNPGYGLAMVDATTGTNLAMPVNNLLRDAGANAAIMSLAVGANGFYGTGYSFQKTTGNLEGAFKSDWNGNLTWLEDCHGDTYSIFPVDQTIYTVGHPHYCGNIGGFGQTTPFTSQRAMAFNDTVAANPIAPDQYGYYNYEGQPHPTLLNWFPDLAVGTFTGQSQAAWTVAGNADYVVVGGEFPTVNGKAQQGLVRFARKALAPNADGPRVVGTDLVVTPRSFAEGVRLSWPANWDRDNELLTYSVIKNNNTANPVYTTTARSTFWQRPMLGFLDRQVTSGTPVSYKLQVSDPSGNTKLGTAVTVTPTGGSTLTAYEKAVLADNPLYYWPLNESAGTTSATDVASAENGTVEAGVTAGVAGAIGDGSTAYRYAGLDRTSTVSTQTLREGIKTLSVEAWFKTTSTKGGKVIGWGTKPTGDSGNSDRQVYLSKTGKLYFGVYPATYKTVGTATAYNDGAWHHVVATLSPDGMKLYADGALVGSRTDTTTAQINSGYWRVGGDFMFGWPDNPSSNGYFTADVDNAAVYNYVLTPAQVAAHFAKPANVRPTAAIAAPPVT